MLTSSQKGNIIESQIANMVTLLSNGDIAASIPIVDDFGIDLLLTKKGSYNTIYLQIKSRFVTNKRNNTCSFGVKKNGFNSHKRMFVLCVYFNKTLGRIDTIWLIPSKELSGDKKKLRIVASKNKLSKDKWSKFKLEEQELVDKLDYLLK